MSAAARSFGIVAGRGSLPGALAARLAGQGHTPYIVRIAGEADQALNAIRELTLKSSGWAMPCQPCGKPAWPKSYLPAGLCADRK
ncbi:MAG: hypothetical protein HC779_00140 [Phyllobacteriaceae bacterium]|nr:hypothetical protein [Phyllobacteriaceae bacterium]